MKDKNTKTTDKAHFQDGHRQSNAFGEIDKEVTPDGNGILKPKSDNGLSSKETDKVVDDILTSSEEE